MRLEAMGEWMVLTLDEVTWGDGVEGADSLELVPRAPSLQKIRDKGGSMHSKLSWSEAAGKPEEGEVLEAPQGK